MNVLTEALEKVKKSDQTPFVDLLLRHPETSVLGLFFICFGPLFFCRVDFPTPFFTTGVDLAEIFVMNFAVDFSVY